MSLWEIELTQNELDEIKEIARARQSTNRGAENPDGAVITSFDADFQGAVGEKALSLIMKKDWDGKHFSYDQWLKWRTSGADVSGLEAKFTLHQKGRLWLRPHQTDHPERPYVLLKGHNLPKVIACGWAFGKEIAQDYNLEEGLYGKPCYYLENYDLRPMEDLIKLIEV